MEKQSSDSAVWSLSKLGGEEDDLLLEAETPSQKNVYVSVVVVY